jgi:hypothetical protein
MPVTSVTYTLLPCPGVRGLLSENVDTVTCGGDTDTNAAIDGALLGAVYGREAIPAQWVESLLSCRPAIGNPHVRNPRPECFWPVDARLLAIRLVAGGDFDEEQRYCA